MVARGGPDVGVPGQHVVVVVGLACGGTTWCTGSWSRSARYIGHGSAHVSAVASWNRGGVRQSSRHVLLVRQMGAYVNCCHRLGSGTGRGV